ncbi:MAG: ABC transporter permease [Thermodesulfobacteria bacterium]|nr:ABC transporter permease [Thermodesulfobacteriota bacterium]
MKRFKPLLSFLALIVLWQAGVVLLKVPDFMFPRPYAVAQALYEMLVDGQLYKNGVASLFRVTWGFYLALVTAVPLGLFLGRQRSMRDFLNPLIQFLRPISPLAWIPVALMWFGIGDKPAIFLIFLSSFFPLVVFTTSSVLNIRSTYLRVARNFGFEGKELYLKVILPAVLPDIVTAIRITLGTAWLVIVAAEMIAVKSGLGYLIIDARNSLRMDRVVAGMVAIGVIGLVLDYLVRFLERMPSVTWSRRRR